ncbi:hypothetical protein Fot_32499 [Forsythia ovata]|uniref:Uncharacterized protein n=1 Tax=Forsythia ovata TaxID=205694 RepID=A0ABD1T802_9LAMI
MPSGSGQIRREKVKRHNLSKFLHLLKFYTKNPNHDLMEHLNAIEVIHRGASLNGHELCREEAVFLLLRTLTGYWRDFTKQLDVMFDRQMSAKFFITNLRERWVIKSKDYRVMERPEGYEPNHHRHQSHNAPWERSQNKYPRCREGYIIEYVPGDP